jgi:hypothetical protein
MKTKNILILTYWDFHDALIQTYTLPYVKIIANQIDHHSKIYLVTLNKNATAINFSHPKIKLLSFKYIPFGMKAIFYYAFMIFYFFLFIFNKKINYIHAWCTPAGVFGYILSILTGRKLIIDSYEPHAESMVEAGQWSKKSLAYKILFFFERKMTHRAKYLIATTKKMITNYAASRFSFNPDKKNWFVKPACIDMELFRPDEKKRNFLRKKLNIENKITGIYAGKFGGIYLENEFFEWLKIAQDYWKDNFHFLLLTSHPIEFIRKKCKEYHIDMNCLTVTFVPHKEVPLYLNAADFALTPVKPVYTKRFCSPIKDGEYWSMGLPVIIPSNISDDSCIIEKHQAGYVLKNFTTQEYLKSVETIDKLVKQNLRDKITEIAKKYRNFDHIQHIYRSIYGD